MKLYDQIFDVVKQFKKLFSPGPVTNADVSGSITAEIFYLNLFKPPDLCYSISQHQIPVVTLNKLNTSKTSFPYWLY